MIRKTDCRECPFKSRAVEILQEDDLSVMSDNCAEVECLPGEMIIKEGTLSSHIAYLKSGLAKIHKNGPGGFDQILKIVPQGSYIGIQTILADKTHRYSASVLENSSVCYINIDLFRQLIKKNGQFAFEIILYLCRDELTYFDRFVNLSQKHVNGRLAEVLLYFSNTIKNSPTFTLPLSRVDLAALIGARRESVTRSLRAFENSGLIRTVGKNVEIINAGKLESISIKG
jgi:CRP/FNR family transcriptional regulator